MKSSMSVRLGAVVSASVLLNANIAAALTPAYTGNEIIDGILSTILYGAIGIAMAFIAFKVIDLLTPGDLSADIAQNNIALAILAGLTMLGICIIIAAAIAG